MLHIDRILVPTDFSACAAQAMVHAEFLARHHHAQLHVLHVTTLFEEDPLRPTTDITTEVLTELYRSVDERLARMVAEQGQKGVEIISAQQRAISVAPAIVDYAKEKNIDLIVAGTHGRRGLGHFLLGSVAEELIRHAHCPVMIVREGPEPPVVEHTIRRILAPMDFSGHARIALQHARELAGFYGAEIDLLHVIEEAAHPSFYHMGSRSIYELIPDLEERSKKLLFDEFEATPGPEVPFNVHVVHGIAAHAIVEFAAEHQSDMVVIATHGLTGLSHFLMGSVTERVARRLHCPVLTVKSFGHQLVETAPHAVEE